MLAGGADYAQCHAAGPDDKPYQRRTWKRANPSLDHMPDLLEAIEREARAARKDPSGAAAFAALRLECRNGRYRGRRAAGRRTPGRASRAPLSGRQDGAGPVWGLDLGTSAAMSAVAAYWPATGALESMAAFPWKPGLAERGVRDGVGDLYVQCAARGELVKCGQNAVELAGLLRIALDRFGPPVVDRSRSLAASRAARRARGGRHPALPARISRARFQGWRRRRALVSPSLS